jgi:hypothetical protein
VRCLLWLLLWVAGALRWRGGHRGADGPRVAAAGGGRKAARSRLRALVEHHAFCRRVGKKMGLFDHMWLRCGACLPATRHASGCVRVWAWGCGRGCVKMSPHRRA